MRVGPRSSGNELIPVPAAVAALAAAGGRVCRIVFDRGVRLRERTAASGFLVGADLVMTSAHVWPSVLAGTTERCGVACVFQDGAVATLARDWLVVHRPLGLDVAVVRINRPSGAARGWIDFPRRPAVIVPEMIVCVVQFPRAAPAPWVSTGFVRRIEGSRLLYTAPTIRGSSGAPVFDAAMQLLAVHRAATEEPANEGVVVRGVGG